MSTLEVLTIRGIRNFGVDAEEEQVCTCFVGIEQTYYCFEYFD